MNGWIRVYGLVYLCLLQVEVVVVSRFVVNAWPFQNRLPEFRSQLRRDAHAKCISDLDADRFPGRCVVLCWRGLCRFATFGAFLAGLTLYL